MSAGLGEWADAQARAAELERMRAPATDPALPGDLARGIRAEALRIAGRPAEALARLEGIREPPGYELVLPSPFHARAREPYLRARLLEETGRIGEARELYARIGHRSLYDLPYREPVRIRLAALGNGTTAGRADGR